MEHNGHPLPAAKTTVLSVSYFDSSFPHLIFGLEQAVDVVEAVEDEADGGGGDLVVAAKVGGGGVAGVGGEHPAAAVVTAVGRVT